MNYYEINENTCALIPVGIDKTRVYEFDNVFVVSQTPLKILNNSCLRHGSSYSGRAAATKFAIGYTHKPPICISEKNLNIFFPTKSSRLKECAWICYNNIYIYGKVGKNCNITFNKNLTVLVDVSYLTIQNQMFRASRLEYHLKKGIPQ